MKSKLYNIIAVCFVSSCFMLLNARNSSTRLTSDSKKTYQVRYVEATWWSCNVFFKDEYVLINYYNYSEKSDCNMKFERESFEFDFFENLLQTDIEYSKILSSLDTFDGVYLTIKYFNQYVETYNMFTYKMIEKENMQATEVIKLIRKNYCF